MVPNILTAPLRQFSPLPYQVLQTGFELYDLMTNNCYCDCALGIIFVHLPTNASAHHLNHMMVLVSRDLQN